MAIKFTLLKKKNLKTKSMQWYATPKSNYASDSNSTTSESAQGSTISDIETEAALRQVGQYIPRELIKGNTMRVPGLGTFRLSFHSKGVDDISDFDPKKLISGTHIVFLPEKGLKQALASQVSFQNAGVKEDDVIYPSVTDYLRKKGLLPTTSPSGTDTGSGTGTGSSSGSGTGGGTTTGGDDNSDGME